MPAPLSGTVLRITPQSSCVVANLVYAAKPQEPQDDTKRPITLVVAILLLQVGLDVFVRFQGAEPGMASGNQSPVI